MNINSFKEGILRKTGENTGKSEILTNIYAGKIEHRVTLKVKIRGII